MTDSDDFAPIPEGEFAGTDLDGLGGLEKEFGLVDDETPAPSGGPSLDGILDALRNTTPNPPLDSVEKPIDMENGGLPRIFRGIQKVAGFDAAEAWFDIVFGAVELMMGAGTLPEATESPETAFFDELGLADPVGLEPEQEANAGDMDGVDDTPL